VSCKITSIDEFAKIIPVSPPTVNKNTNPNLQRRVGVIVNEAPCNVAIHLKIFTPVGIAIIIVAAVK
jgi:hypothetical protein